MKIPLADAPLQDIHLPVKDDGIQLLIIAGNLITSNLPTLANELQEICAESRKDPVFTVLHHYFSTGWPSNKMNVPTEIHICGWNLNNMILKPSNMCWKMPEQNPC